MGLQDGVHSYRQLQRRFITARERAALVGHHEARLMQLRQDVIAEEQRGAELNAGLAAEVRDVDKIEKLSWLRLKAKLREGVDQAKLREELEVQAAIDAVTSSQEELNFLRLDIERSNAALIDLAQVNVELVATRSELAAFAQANYPHVASQLTALEDEAGTLRAEAAEIGEAITAGDALLVEVNALEAQLRKTKRLSSWDTYFQGGILVSIYKRDSLHISTELSRSVSHAMESFDKELSETTVDGISVQLENAMSHGMWDIWFNSAWIHMRVDSNIIEAQANAAMVREKVAETLATLRSGLDAIVTRIGSIDAQGFELLARPQDSV